MAGEFVTKCLDRLERVIIAQRDPDCDKEPNIIRKARRDLSDLLTNSRSESDFVEFVNIRKNGVTLRFINGRSWDFAASKELSWTGIEDACHLAIEINQEGPIRYRIRLDGKLESSVRCIGGDNDWDDWRECHGDYPWVREKLLAKFGLPPDPAAAPTKTIQIIRDVRFDKEKQTIKLEYDELRVDLQLPKVPEGACYLGKFEAVNGSGERDAFYRILGGSPQVKFTMMDGAMSDWHGAAYNSFGNSGKCFDLAKKVGLPIQ